MTAEPACCTMERLDLEAVRVDGVILGHPKRPQR